MPEQTAPGQPIQQVSLDELYRIKGELVTQLEIANGKLQIINSQIQQIYNQQGVIQK